LAAPWEKIVGELAYSISVWLIPLVIAIVCHEVAHGWVANMLGDPTASEQGRLTLNPVKHADPVGTVILPLMLAIAHAPIFGWAKPVPVVAERLRNPRIDMMLVAIAGPAINLFLGALAAVGLGALFASTGGEDVSGALGFLADNLVNFLLINVFLAVFNLLPIPPFDGGHVVEGLLPRSIAPHYAKLGRYGFLILIVLIVALPMLAPEVNIVERVVAPIVNAITRFFLGSVNLGV
jgi:Zn-dependent protease